MTCNTLPPQVTVYYIVLTAVRMENGRQERLQLPGNELEKAVWDVLWTAEKLQKKKLYIDINFLEKGTKGENVIKPVVNPLFEFVDRLGNERFIHFPYSIVFFCGQKQKKEIETLLDGCFTDRKGCLKLQPSQSQQTQKGETCDI